MRCAHCDAEFRPKRSTGKFCSAKCRGASWQASRDQEVTRIETDLERTLGRVRGLHRRRGS